MQFDAKAAAIEAATLVFSHLLGGRRGVMPWRQHGIAVVFGNDGYSFYSRSRDEVESVRERLRERGIEELDFGLDAQEGYSWAMLVRSEDVGALFEAIWRSRPDVDPGRDETDLGVIAAHGL
jgi:hypothetical protein